jgi:hypothetical protein
MPKSFEKLSENSKAFNAKRPKLVNAIQIKGTVLKIVNDRIIISSPSPFNVRQTLNNKKYHYFALKKKTVNKIAVCVRDYNNILRT